MIFPACTLVPTPYRATFRCWRAGFEIKNGELGTPVKEITIAGNFIELLGKITHVGSEVYFDMPSLCRIGSPSLLVDFLSVSGKA